MAPIGLRQYYCPHSDQDDVDLNWWAPADVFDLADSGNRRALGDASYRLAGGAVAPPSVVDVCEGGNFRRMPGLTSGCCGAGGPFVAGPVGAGEAAVGGVSDDVPADDDAVDPAAAVVVVGCVDLGVFPSHPLPDART